MKQLWYIRFTLADTSHSRKRCSNCFVGKKSILEEVFDTKFDYIYFGGLLLTSCSKRAHLTNRITTMKTQLANGIDDNSLILEVPRINVVLMSLKHIKAR